MAKRRRRITPFGYLVLIIIILLMVVGIYFIVWSMRREKPVDPAAEATADMVGSAITPTPSLAPIGTQDTTAAPQTTIDPATVTTAPTPAQTDTPKPDDTPTPSVKTPSPSQVSSAVDGTLNASGVVLRKGPTPQYDIIGKYSSGTQLKIYALEGDYYFVMVVKENLYGYFAAKFVDKKGLLPGETATPTPEAPSGVIAGKVSASVVALRDAPSLESNKISQAENGDAVYIYFKTGDFYYIEVVGTGTKCYAYASYIQADSSNIPTGTPVP